ncbi:MAG: pitrilysin family protein [Planctomycetota bacterium]|nr:pitrilysin family protein [Planctomycetota bacterium]
MPPITTITLECGLPLLCETIPGVRSAGVTWLLPAGTAREPAGRLGLGAMWAELLMRGAGDLDSRAQADAFDALGVSRGTGVETFHVSVTATLLGSRLAGALPLLVDMVRRPRMDGASVEPARDLCMQSIESLQDDPPERLMLLLKQLHAPEPINRSALGTMEGLQAITADELLPEWRARAVPAPPTGGSAEGSASAEAGLLGGGAVLAIAGDVDPAAVARQLDGLLKGWSGSAQPVAWTPRQRLNPAQPAYHHEQDKTNQVHIALAYDGPSERDPSAWPERLATAVLSQGMGSRLFTEVREKRGLCYSVSTSYSTDAAFGRSVAYVGTTPEKAQQSLDVLLAELRRIRTAEGAVTSEEFARAVTGMKSKLVMSGESSSARAAALARDWHRLGRPRSLDEMARAIDRLTLEDVNRWLASGPALSGATIVTLGPAALRA